MLGVNRIDNNKEFLKFNFRRFYNFTFYVFPLTKLFENDNVIHVSTILTYVAGGRTNFMPYSI